MVELDNDLKLSLEMKKYRRISADALDSADIRQLMRVLRMSLEFLP
jgi:hypothetical protein